MSSRRLESVSASFLLDAQDFFHGLWPTPGKKFLNRLNKGKDWGHLKTLALTSRLLHPGVPNVEIEKLLRAAGATAALMPKLEVMELWNAGQGHACYFRFERDETPTITLQGTWDLKPALI
ncbi:hypothetical protein QBC33DRAFT_520600 [Phialemonium atrogriseum]|uniref:DUF6546 domain-containing protein n=1 Tax=Phialemonium atrogriseum TaxID=1093897 RepID=A0AAJ0FRA9_9PEZI|nr:uncharacterized protein QBC33DRAFT_520600 [Phialemonium atrogriseum]KAK1772229.1 hypothetical protein QBC33DRAFT_520600 [Phialemonium atrogriseum]